MSFTVGRWAVRTICRTGPAKCLLMILADYAKDDGSHAYPSIPTLCTLSSYDERTVRKALNVLVEDGMVTAHQRFTDNGKQLSTEYRLIARETAPAKVRGVGRAASPAKVRGIRNAAPPTKVQGVSPADLPDIPPISASAPPANVGGNPIKNPTIEGTSLRDGTQSRANGAGGFFESLGLLDQETPERERPEPGEPVAVAPGPSDVDTLWAEAVPILTRLRKASDPSAGTIVGRLLKVSSHDPVAVLDAIRAADRTPPLHLLSWLTRAIQNQIDPLPVTGRIRPFDASKLSGAPALIWKLQQEEAERQTIEGRAMA